MGCNKFTTSKAKARNYLIQNKIADKYNNILDLNEFRKTVKTYKLHAKRIFPTIPDSVNPIYEDKLGKKVLFNREFFLRVDANRGIFYKENLPYKGIESDFSKIPTKEGFYIQKTFPKRLESPNKVVQKFPTITKKIVKLHSLKENFISLSWKKYIKNKNEIDSIIKQAGNSIVDSKLSKRRRELKKENEQLVKKIEEAKKEVSKLSKKIKVSQVNIIVPFVEREVEILNDLIENYTPENEILASNIADTLIELGKVDYSDFEGRSNANSHILFTKKQMFDDDRNIKLDPKLVEKLIEWGKIGKDKKALISQRGENMLVEIAKTQGTKALREMKDGAVAKLMQQPLSELTLFDMYFMDTTNGVFSHNGVIPQLMKHILDTVSEKSLKNVRDVGDKLAEADKRLNKYFQQHPELAKKYSLKTKLGVNKIDYQKLFLKIDEKGMRMVSMFNQGFYKEREKLYKSFEKKLNNSKLKRDPRARKEAKRVAYRDFSNSMNRLIEHIQPAYLIEDDMYKELVKYTSVMNQYFGNKNLGGGHKLQKFFSKLNDDNHKNDYINRLKTKLTANGYEKIKKDVSIKINEFLEERKAFHENTLTEEDIRLAKAGKPFTQKTSDLLYEFEFNNNPIFTQFFFETKHQGKQIKTPVKTYNNSWLNSRFNITIPKEGRYYSEQYQTIHNDDVLTSVFNDFKGAWDLFESMMPKHERDKLIDGQIIYTEQLFSDMIHSGKSSLDAFTKNYFTRSMDNFKKKITFKRANEVSYAHVDSKGRKTYKINPAFIKKNRRKIERRKDILKSELFIIASRKQGKVISSFKAVDRKIGTEFLNEVLAKHNTSLKRFEGSTADKFETAISFAAENQLALESSYDLPKILNTMVSLAQDYKFRDDALPTLTFLQNHYSQIKLKETDMYGDKVSADNILANKTSQRRLTQSESWFNNVVLGDFSPKEKALFLQKETPKTKLEVLAKKFKMDWLIPKVRKIKTSAEKDETKNLQKQLDEMEIIYEKLKGKPTNKLTEEEKGVINLYEKLKEDLDSIGSMVSGTDIVQGAMYYLRTMALGWNLNSGATNLIEGQISNHTNAIRLGIPPEDLMIVTPQDIMKAKTLPQGMVSEDAWKALQLIDSYDMFQNGANEIQRAEANKKRERYKKVTHPFFITEQVEYLNQIPLMVAMMKNFDVYDKNRNKSNLFDALQRTEKPDGTLVLELKEDFKTEENVKNFELKDGEQYSELKSWINKAITDGHGLYGANDSILIKNTVGAPAIMYKNWLPRMMYVWLGTAQRDIRASYNTKGNVAFNKGKLRSITPSQALLLGLSGAIITSPLLGIASGTIMSLAVAAKVSGGNVLGKTEFGIQTTSGFARQLLLESKIIFLKMIGMTTTVIPSKKLRKKYNSHTLTREAFNKFNKDNLGRLTQTDIYNFESNMQSLSQLFMMFALFILVKAVGWDDDDDKEGMKRRTHNYLANKLLQLSSQSAMYSNPFALRTTLSDTAIVTFFSNVSKTITSFEGVISGDDTIMSGSNVGQSKFFNSFSKTFIPPAFRGTINTAIYEHKLASPTLGLKAPSDKQYEKGIFDKLFMNKLNKLENELKMKRAKMRMKLLTKFNGDKKKVRASLKEMGFYPKKEEKEDIKNFRKILEEL